MCTDYIVNNPNLQPQLTKFHSAAGMQYAVFISRPTTLPAPSSPFWYLHLYPIIYHQQRLCHGWRS